MSDFLAPTEILALAKILDELDYYQVLHIGTGVSATDVRQAFHASSRAFHPDANRHLDADHREAIARIAGEMTDALAAGDLDRVGRLVGEEGRLRNRLAPSVATPMIRSAYTSAWRKLAHTSFSTMNLRAMTGQRRPWAVPTRRPNRPSTWKTWCW